ncbi:cobalamin biosynthesis protein [Nocardia sp. NPDC004654]|uniref:cobalamin biosynthesis protein n=1 Tax=Nocardia sp. NPDC004654 TaxID=3154776 RepID=UPI0033A11CC0
MRPTELRPPVAVGIGMRPGAAAAAILAAVRHVLGDEPLACLATIDRRADEPGLQVAAGELGVPVRTFAATELDSVTVPTPAVRTKAAVGAASVAEAAAVLAAGGGVLLQTKKMHRGVTVAVARPDVGQARGSVVG